MLHFKQAMNMHKAATETTAKRLLYCYIAAPFDRPTRKVLPATNSAVVPLAMAPSRQSRSCVLAPRTPTGSGLDPPPLPSSFFFLSAAAFSSRSLIPSAHAASAHAMTNPNVGADRVNVTVAPNPAATKADRCPANATVRSDVDSFMEIAPFRLTSAAAVVHPKCIARGRKNSPWGDAGPPGRFPAVKAACARLSEYATAPSNPVLMYMRFPLYLGRNAAHHNVWNVWAMANGTDTFRRTGAKAEASLTEN
mmetsp:Transcript_39491/g.118547  ORF Transcript_39491/g.118547 Transcript_39491/m.118547 type:complete len:251 (+) Transcript_39491:167-919(+)